MANNNDNTSINDSNNNDSIREIIKESIEESIKSSDSKPGSKPVFFQKKLIPLSMSLFLAIALSILFFFILYNFKDVNISLGKFLTALKPFIYGGVIFFLSFFSR